MTSPLNFVERALPNLCLLIYVLAAGVGPFAGGLWSALGIGGAICMFLGTSAIERKAPIPDARVMALVALTIATIVLLNLHTDYPSIAWRRLLQLVTIIAPLSLFSSRRLQARINHDRMFPIVTIAAAVGALAITVELMLGGPLLHTVRAGNIMLTAYNRGVSYLVVLEFPLMAYLWSSRRRWELGVFVFIMLLPASLTESRATQAAFLLGVAATIAAFLAPIITRRTLVVLLIASAALPFCVMEIFLRHHTWFEHLPSSWQHRVDIWDYMSYRILERPFLGWGLGMGSSRLLPYLLPHGDLYRFVDTEAANPHDVIIQLWVDLGLSGMALGLLFALPTLYKASRLPPPIAPFALGAWVAAWCISLVAYDFWTDSLFALFALTSLAFVLLVQQRQENKRRREEAYPQCSG